MSHYSYEGTLCANVDGLKLAYREEGSGEPVVFVHGGLSDLTTWQGNVSEVGRSHRAITYSRRFARPNDDMGPDAADPWEQHVHDLAGFLNAIEAAPAHLVGSSQGAFIALRTAILYPESVTTLTLEEPPVIPLFVSFPPRPLQLVGLLLTRPGTAIPLIQTIFGSVMPATKAFERGDDEQGMRSFLAGSLGKQAMDALSDEHWTRLRANLSQLRALMLHPGFPPLTDDDVRAVKAPTLLLTGEHSPAFLLRLTDRLEELLPTTDRIEIPNASHVMHEDNPPAVNAAILGFLKRQARSA